MMEFTLDVAEYGWMIDAILVVLLLGWACAKCVKGLYKSLMPLVVIAAALLGGTFISAVIASPVTKLVYPLAEEKIIQKIGTEKLPEEKLEQWSAKLTDPEKLADEVRGLIPKGYMIAAEKLEVDLSDFLKDRLALVQEHVDIHDYLDQGQIDKLEKAGVEVEKATETALTSTANAIRAEGVVFSTAFSLTYRLVYVGVRYLLWAIFSVALLAALTTIKNVFGIAFDFPVIGWVDRLGGALLGVAEGCVVVFVLGWITRFLGFPILQELAKGTKILKLLV